MVVGDGRAVGVELQFVGLSGLIQGFMADARIVARLGNELGPCIASELAVVRATWDSEIRIGTITLELEPADLACLPKVADGSVDVSALEPLNRALANYRDEVSNNYDLRIQSFRTGIKVLSGMNHCALWSGGQYPPDGSTFSRCVDSWATAIACRAIRKWV